MGRGGGAAASGAWLGAQVGGRARRPGEDGQGVYVGALGRLAGREVTGLGAAGQGKAVGIPEPERERVEQADGPSPIACGPLPPAP